MLIAHKIALMPNNKQATYFAKACGCARKAYNWALDEWQKQYEAWKLDNSLPKPMEDKLRKKLNSIKRSEFPWMLEVTKCAPQLAIMQLGQAFQNFFAKRAKYPVVRKKGVHDRFSISNDQFKIKNKQIQIPKLGWVKMTEPLRFSGKIMSATVSRIADRWFVSICVDVPELTLPKAENQGEAGIDLGIHSLATLSTGETIRGPKPHKALLQRLKRLSRSLSRKEKGSRNRNKAKQKLAKLHAKIANIRSNALHQLTTNLTRRFHTIGIEDLNVRGMQKNRRLSRSIADMSFFEFRRQLEYKAEWRGGLVIVADKFFASSKTCSKCGHKLDKLPLSIRKWQCPSCNTEHDRDINAAVNLRNLAVSSTVSVCGEESSDFGRKPKVKLASVKQKANSRFSQK
jgi:putative transposase